MSCQKLAFVPECHRMVIQISIGSIVATELNVSSWKIIRHGAKYTPGVPESPIH